MKKKVLLHLERASRSSKLDQGEYKRKTHLLSYSRDQARRAASIGTIVVSPTFRLPSSYSSSSTVCRWWSLSQRISLRWWAFDVLTGISSAVYMVRCFESVSQWTSVSSEVSHVLHLPGAHSLIQALSSRRAVSYSRGLRTLSRCLHRHSAVGTIQYPSWSPSSALVLQNHRLSGFLCST